ncbi:hypothetical protein Tsp_09866 [Trichinella spiralis]|uniref:hypothetical protein n=1 Tax=Trichinella spiralis TaxID=6334 RepID=UPI0001EFDC0D|nr:hypothetical protein Tsp_09866 [Trichinella spiralis]
MTGCSIWPACCQHPALDPSRYVASLSLNDRFHLYPQRAYYLLVSVIACVCVGIPYVQFYGTFIVQCPRPHLRQQRQQKMKKPDISKSSLHSLPSRKQPITTSLTRYGCSIVTDDADVALVVTCCPLKKHSVYNCVKSSDATGEFGFPFSGC